MPRAAITKSRSRTSSSRARTMRASTGQDSSAITQIVGHSPVPVIEASTSSRITGGKVIARSTNRIVAPSAQRPPNAASAPTRNPIASEIDTESAATSSEVRPPCISRASTSRPTPSVPSQCRPPGGALRASRSTLFGP